jgi:CRP-like cAMP-binding protein
VGGVSSGIPAKKLKEMSFVVIQIFVSRMDTLLVEPDHIVID